MRARLGSQQDIENARVKSNIINEIPVQELHNDARAGQFEKLSSYEAYLRHQGCSQEQQDVLLRANHRRFKRWQTAPSKDVVYSDNFHDQQEKED